MTRSDINRFGKADLNLALRADLTTFIHRVFQTISGAQIYSHNWHIEAMAWHLERCARGEIQRLVITLPPRYLKSICASVALPAWVLGHDASKRIICASYSQELAIKHSRDCRSIMNAGWYKQIFPQTRISSGKDTEVDFETTRQGFRFASSVGGTLTGRGGNIIIIDDPLKPDDAMSEAKRTVVNEWFSRTVYSRLDDKRRDVIIVIMQRVHAEDLAGHILIGAGWVHLNLPAICEVSENIPIGANRFHTREPGDLLHAEREPREVLDQLKASMGGANFSAQYQQRPIPADGEMVKWSWFGSYEEPPLRGPGDNIMQSWDTASTAGELSDYSACSTWLVDRSKKRYYLLHVLRQKLSFPDLRRIALEHAMEWRAKVILIENKGTGTSLIQEFWQDCAYGVPAPVRIRPDKDKVTRMSAATAKIEAGCVLLPRSAPWLEDFKVELLQFPRGQHDDQVDSVSQFLNWVDKHTWTIEEFLV